MDLSLAFGGALEHYTQYAESSSSSSSSEPLHHDWTMQHLAYPPGPSSDMQHFTYGLPLYEATIHQPVGIRPILPLLATYSTYHRASPDDLHPPLDFAQPSYPPAPLDMHPHWISHSPEDADGNGLEAPPSLYGEASSGIQTSLDTLPEYDEEMGSPSNPVMQLKPHALAPEPGPLEGEAVAGSLDLTTGQFYHSQEHPRLRTAQACDKCRMRKAKCSGESPCKRCVVRGLVCEYIGERKVRGSVKNRSRRGSVRDRSASDASTVSTASTSATSDDPVPSSPDMSAFSDLAQDMSSLSAFEKPRSMSLHIGMESTIYHRRRSTASDASDSGSCSSSEGISGGFLSLPDANASTLLSRRRAQSLSSPILTPRPMHAAARSAGTMPPSPLGQWTPMTLAYPESQDFRFGNPPLLHGNYLEEVTPRVDQAQQAWIETSAVNPFPEY